MNAENAVRRSSAWSFSSIAGALTCEVDVLPRRDRERTAIVATELRRTRVTDAMCCVADVRVVRKEQPSRGLQASALLVLQRRDAETRFESRVERGHTEMNVRRESFGAERFCEVRIEPCGRSGHGGVVSVREIAQRVAARSRQQTIKELPLEKRREHRDLRR